MTETREEREQSPRQRFARLITRLARELDDGNDGALPRGELAELRRDDGALSPTFYKLAMRVLEEPLAFHTREEDRVEAERRWARVVWALAKLGGQQRHGMSFGAALAAADLGEQRFLRLLRAEGDAIDAALRAAIAPLAQKAIDFDAYDLAALVLSAPHARRFHFETGDDVRRRIARDYYRAQRKPSDSEGASS